MTDDRKEMLDRAQHALKIGVMIVGKDGTPLPHYQLGTAKDGTLVRLETLSGRAWEYWPSVSGVGAGSWRRVEEMD